jgi:acyl-CoA synthetase (AMP-forming)/AMP-acid ligase II
MTETATVVTSTSEHDICPGTSGSLIPGARGKVVDPDGKEITEYGKPGELLVQSPSVVLGYLNNEKATDEAFVYHEDGRWLRTGDEVIVTKAESGYEHVTIVDRLKELIKVKVRTKPPFLSIIIAELTPHNRATKSPPPSSRPTSSRTPPSTTAPSSRCPTSATARRPRRTS